MYLYSIDPRIPPGRLKGLAASFKRSHLDSDIVFLGAWNCFFLLVSRTISAQYVSIFDTSASLFSLIFSFGAQLGSRCLWRSILESPGIDFDWSYARGKDDTTHESRKRLATTMQHHSEWGVHYALLESSIIYLIYNI